MKLPVIEGTIRRRILVNYRVEPRAIQRCLPPRFRPKLHDGHAVAGICLIRLERVRPRGLPGAIGISSENAAHRVAVLWDDAQGNTQEGVFVTRRDTNSQLNHWLGGRVFPGEHHRADFNVVEDSGTVDVSMKSHDASVSIDVAARHCNSWPGESIFASLDAASAFFATGRVGYSVTRDPRRLDGIELAIDSWAVRPLEVLQAHSSFFDDESLFPRRSIAFDHALFMHDLAHEWHSVEAMCL